MIFTEIRQAIIDKINNDLTKIEVAYRNPRSTFAGFPAAVVLPSDNEADYSSTVDNKLTVVFKIMIYYPVKNEDDYDNADAALEEALDECLTVFTRNALGTACEWVEPAPSVWLFDTRGEGVYRVAEVTLRCRKYMPN